MIRLTLTDGSPIYFNPEHIKIFTANTPNGEWSEVFGEQDKPAGLTDIYVDDGVFEVKESPEEVARKVLEWRLYMENRIYALNNGEKDLASTCRRMMLKLAGLEEGK